uniref:Uncharacterized protein n=1 Tax=Tanacetum cinerariifolium TaxID=118510 RepID=A0A6L2K639_TANCI|nr:hypothetical protein [Tanacetum cinerariifolium]
MTTTTAQQVAVDNALVPLEKRVKIGKCNMKIDPAKAQKEPTYQVVLDALALTTCYPAFLITADICPRLLNQDFDELLSASPKMKRKLKKDASPSKKRTLVNIEEEELKPANKVVSSEEPAAKRYEGANFESEVPDEPKGKTIDISVGTGLKPRVLDVSKCDSFEKANDDEQETKDEFAHTPLNYVPTGDKRNDVTEEVYERINEELYGDVNVKLIDAEPADKEKDDEEMTVASHVNDVKELKDVDNSIKVISTIQSEVPKAIKEYLESILDDAMHKVIQKHAADIIKEHSIPAETVERLNPKQRALYHALMESILEDEDAMDKGVANKLNKRKPDDADKDEGPSAGSDRGLKRPKTSKDTEPSNKAKSTKTKGTSNGTSKSHPKSTSKSAQAEDIVFEVGDTQGPHNLGEDTGTTYNILKGMCRFCVKLDYNMEECYKALTNQLDWNNPEGDRYPFDLSKPLPLVMSGNHQIVLVDYFFNNDLAYLQGGSTDRTYMTSLTKTNAANTVFIHDVCSIEIILAVTNVKVKEWYGYGHLEEIENRLFNLKCDVIMHLAAALRMFTRRIVIQKRVEDLQLGIKIYQKKLNISRPMMCKARIVDLKPYFS